MNVYCISTSRYGLLLVLAGVYLLTFPVHRILPRLATTAHQLHVTHTTTRPTTHTTPIASATPVIVPQPPTASSLGLADSTQTYIDIAWNDAWSVESEKTSVFPLIFVKQMRQESGYNPNALSPAGAIGVAQFMPSTASSLGINPYNPSEALLGAARLMVSYIHTYHSYALALAAYNAGSGLVTSCLTTPDWYGCLPLETENYITAILN